MKSHNEVQWRNIKKVVDAIAKECFGGPEQEGKVSLAAAYLAVKNSLTAKDGIDISTLNLEKYD